MAKPPKAKKKNVIVYIKKNTEGEILKAIAARGVQSFKMKSRYVE